MSKPDRFEAVAAIIAAHLEQAAKEIRSLIEGSTLSEAESLTYSGQLVARVNQVDNQTRFLPVESLKIRADAGTITNFLVPRILEPLKEKHGLNYRLFEKEGVLDVLVVYGTVEDKQLKELKSAVAWAFYKAAFGEQFQNRREENNGSRVSR